jgi:hypothetical protein
MAASERAFSNFVCWECAKSWQPWVKGLVTKWGFLGTYKWDDLLGSYYNQAY